MTTHNDEKFEGLKKIKKIGDNVIKVVRNLFRLKKEIDDTATKDIKILFRLKKENETIKDRAIRDIRNIFEHKEEEYYKSVRVGNV